MTENLELQPTFPIQVFLDGDDDAQSQTDDMRAALDRVMKKLKNQGYCIGYEIHPATLDDGTIAKVDSQKKHGI